MCLSPITIKKNTADSLTVGCGRCEPCHIKYVNQWSLRFRIHANYNPIFFCVTLTYSGKNLPYVTTKQGKTYMTLYRAHATNFFKTLRNNHNKTYKNVPKPKISYLICGEYGDKFKRPHYHAIIFGASRSDIIKSWKYGEIHFGASDLEATVNYTLKYAVKSRLYKIYNNTAYERPFINVSKGIGLDLICDPLTGEARTTKLPELIQVKSHTVQLPRYYTSKLGINLDTEKYKELSIEKHRLHAKLLKEQNSNTYKYVKEYHKNRYDKSNPNSYNNEIITNIDSSQIKRYSP